MHASGTKDWKVDRQYYSELAVDFRLLKDAWRNFAMHGNVTYDATEATVIYNHVREFMGHLAERINDVKIKEREEKSLRRPRQP